MRKLIAKLITNFQPRMTLGRKRFLEQATIESRTEQERQEAARERRRERGELGFVSERETPTEDELRGPSEPSPK